MSFTATAKIASIDKMFGAFFSDKKNSLTTRTFFGLRFLIDESNTKCSSNNHDQLICQLDSGAQIIFERTLVSSPSALDLLRLNRKARWAKEYALLNQYVEQPISIANGSTILQEAAYCHLDNINWPVLIRAFDVVMNDKTTINVTTICDKRLWDANRQTVQDIERSMNKTTANNARRSI